MTAFTDLHPSTRRAVIRRLDKAAELIEQGWTRQASARDADGNAVGVADAGATCWCLDGAIYRAMEDMMPSKALNVARMALHYTSMDLYGEPPITVNDTIARDRRTPLRLLRETKKRLEAQA